jgi:uncharacterized coiled-coil DUF342 family protein
MKELLQRKNDLRKRIDGLRSELLSFDRKREQLLEAEFDYRILLDQITEAESQERSTARLAAEAKKKAPKKEWVRNL